MCDSSNSVNYKLEIKYNQNGYKHLYDSLESINKSFVKPETDEVILISYCICCKAVSCAVALFT